MSVWTSAAFGRNKLSRRTSALDFTKTLHGFSKALVTLKFVWIEDDLSCVILFVTAWPSDPILSNRSAIARPLASRYFHDACSYLVKGLSTGIALEEQRQISFSSLRKLT